MNKKSFSLLSCFLLSGLLQIQAQQLTRFVDPFIGTDAHGHTFPGATVPFGMVQLSPDTGTEGWDWCSGYHSSDSSIIGFSHTHLSGTGGADYGDILLMPTVGGWKTSPGTKEKPELGYRSRFSHATEKASPGFYSVELSDYKIIVELTTTNRVGVHRYTFPRSAVSNIIVDLDHGISDEVLESELEIIGIDEVAGVRRSKGWANDQYVFFVMKFSKPFRKFATVDGENVNVDARKISGKAAKGILRFNTKENESIEVKVALSSVSIDGARRNLQAEVPGWDFDQIKSNAATLWENQLSKIKVEEANDSTSRGNENKLRTFYTALYHSMIHPNIMNDVDGQYRGMDKKIHSVQGGNHYTVFSLWDTFRALHPLFSIINPELNNEFCKSILEDYKQAGKLPVWELWGNETNTMIGYHSVPVLSDMILKNQSNFNNSLAFEAMKKSAMEDGQGLKYYKVYGIIPHDMENNSVSKQLEYAYDDWCIAQVAKKLGKQNDYEYFLGRSLNYKNVFDASTGFMRGRNLYGAWSPGFDPTAVSILGSGDFTEGNAWQYSFFAPQDINGLMDLYGGDSKFAAKLDSLFNQKAGNNNAHVVDVTGLIGQYAHGNEPSHHVAYLYNYAGQPWKTQERVSQIMTELYTDKRDGISGNDDCGQTSAWYVFSALGMYPVNPASGEYILGSPLFSKTTIDVDSGKSFVIEAKNVSNENKYIQSTMLNDQPYNFSFLTHSDIENGGSFTFEMGSQLSKAWGVNTTSRPKSHASFSKEEKTAQVLFMPFEVTGKKLFNDKKSIQLKSNSPGATIRYNISNTPPDQTSKLYTQPFTINKSTVIKAIAINPGGKFSDVSELTFLRAVTKPVKGKFPKINSTLKPGPIYSNGAAFLLDGNFGSLNYRDGEWVGTNQPKFEFSLELEKPLLIKSIRARFMENTGSWIFLPKSIDFKVSIDGNEYISLGKDDTEIPFSHPEISVKEFKQDYKGKDRIKFIKIEVVGTEKIPGWHPGAGNPPWMFSDEIVVEY